MSVLIVTSLGDIVIDLFTDRCPLTCKNFLKLCRIKYYNGCLFHSVQKDFTAQTGDPTGTGSGGDSIFKYLYGEQARFFGDEIHLDLKHSKTGTIAMASAGENLNASQFYVTLRDDLDYLDGKHTVFGELAEGLETLSRINEAYVDENNRPYKNIRIKHTYILEDPFEEPSQLAELIPDASPEGKPKDEVDDDVRLEDDWVPMEDTLGMQQVEEVLREKEAHSRAVVLETIGDIPEAEVKPPDNVLFVCKLNPVTEDDDLNTIFSRFGTVTSADIIRDFKTGDSLCYAFIEFEDREACEQAYYKMDNALIDDRRIHVDFSQSVAKLWSQYRRQGQTNKGKGCFKCGSLDHIAKDCTGDQTNTQQHSKYVLKDGNRQHGNSSYDMVFEGDELQSPKKDKLQRDHETEKDNKANHRNGDEERERRKEVHQSHRHGERSRDHRDNNEKHQGDRTKAIRDRDYRAKDEVDSRRKEYSSDRNKREDERYARDSIKDRRKEYSSDRNKREDERHDRDSIKDRRKEYSSDRNKREDERHDRDSIKDRREYERKSSDDHHRRDYRDSRSSDDHYRRDHRDSRKRSSDDRGDAIARNSRNDSSKHGKHHDIESGKGRDGERDSGKKRVKEDDSHYDRDSRRRH